MNNTVDDNKTLQAAFKEASSAPEKFMFNGLPNESEDNVDLIIGYFKDDDFERWFKLISLNYNWSRKSSFESPEENNNDNKTGKLLYSKEEYFGCFLRGKFKSKSKKSNDAIVNQTVSSIKSDCPARLYVKQQKGIPGYKLIGFVPTHNHAPQENGPLNAVARDWLVDVVEKGYTRSQIAKILFNLHGQRNRSQISMSYRPFLRIQTSY